VPKLRSLFLTSNDPARTAQFYRDVAQLEMERVGDAGSYQYWRLDEDGMQIAIHDAKAFADYAYPPLAASNATHLYFHIEDRDAFLSHLNELGIRPSRLDAVVVTVIDPDGRHVMFGTA
jgi:hypothetical protein